MATRADRPQQRRNAELIEQLIRTQRVVLRRQANRHCPSQTDVDDVLQRAYELFIERYVPPYEPLPWLMTTIKREAWSRGKQTPCRHEIPITTKDDSSLGGYDLGDCLPDPNRGPAEVTVDHDLDDRIRDQIRRLKPDERTALGLLGLGYSYEEICLLRGWTYTKVNRCVSEGRARLREAIREA